jgi:putative ABC transport system substrate-binding protein
MRALAQELVGLQPDIILTVGIAATVAVQQQTRTIPIVFVTTGDPVGPGGIVARLNQPLKVAPIMAPVHDDAEIEAAIIALGRELGGGLVVMGDPFMTVHRVPIISAAARNNVPAVYTYSYFVRDGGLLSYGVGVDNFRRAASYVDRILKGEKPGDLPVQLPTKFEMLVNRKTAKVLGLAIPPSILLRADEVIE